MLLADYPELYTEIQCLKRGTKVYVNDYPFSTIDLVIAIEYALPHRSYSVWRSNPNTLVVKRAK
jgi:hypothetical protein